jgi:hypothetical protein
MNTRDFPSLFVTGQKAPTNVIMLLPNDKNRCRLQLRREDLLNDCGSAGV